MYFLDADTVDIRRFCGYATVDAALDPTLAALVPEAGVVVVSQLATLRTLEAAIITAADNLDTDKAAVWTRNRSEIADRDRMFYAARLRLCNTLGVLPGQFIGAITFNGIHSGVAPSPMIA